MAEQTNRRKDRFIRDRIMFKLQEMISHAINKFFEWSFQRNANNQFKKRK